MHKNYDNFAEILLNELESLLANAVKADTIATPIKPQSRAYSKAVAPDSLATNFFNDDMVSLLNSLDIKIILQKYC